MADPFTEADGRQLAVDMLRALGAQWAEDSNAFGERYMDGDDLGNASENGITEALIDREPDIMRRYLVAVRGKASPALERGFLCQLSEYLGSAVNSAAMDLEHYEAHEEQRHG